MVATSFCIGALMTPSSCESACSFVGRLATLSRSFAESTAPPIDRFVGTSLSLAFAKSLITRAAAPGSSFEKASTSGPFSTAPIDSNAVPARALRASVFLTTRMYTPEARALERRSVIWVTVRPRYSAATTDRAFAATALTSSTRAFLPSRFSGIDQTPVESPYTRVHMPAACRPTHHTTVTNIDSRCVHHLRRPLFLIRKRSLRTHSVAGLVRLRSSTYRRFTLRCAADPHQTLIPKSSDPRSRQVPSSRTA